MSDRNPDKTATPSASWALLPNGTPAPDFTLNSGPGVTTSLQSLRGRATVLVFYPADWSPVCGDELALFNQLGDVWDGLNAQLVGISVDGVWCHKAFAENRKFRFQLLSDFEPKGAVARAYRAFRDKEGVAERALYVLDAAGVIRWSYLSPIKVNPGADGILAALEALTPEQRGEVGGSPPQGRAAAPAPRSSEGEARA